MAEVFNPGVSASQARRFEQYGGGFVDYGDQDYIANVVTVLPAGVPVVVTRNLVPSATNNRLNAPFAGWSYWDNTAKLVRSRALYDTFVISTAIRLIADALGGKLTLALVTASSPAITVASKTITLTAPVGTEEQQRIDFQVATRSSFANNGAQFILTSTVPASLSEFSPEFFPEGYEP